MTTIAEIPLRGAETFQVTLANTVYNLSVIWRDPFGWFLDIARQDGTKLVSGIPMVSGIDLLQPYPQFQFGGALVLATDGNPTADPTFDNLGTACHLYFVTP